MNATSRVCHIFPQIQVTAGSSHRPVDAQHMQSVPSLTLKERISHCHAPPVSFVLQHPPRGWMWWANR